MNDDDADFKPSQSTSSNLTSLFGTNRPRSSGNQTLTYTAPKPPRSGESSGTPAKGSSSKSLGTEKLEIIISKNIQLFKLENGKYVGQGAAGIAIIGHYDLHMYQIILYKNNKEYLSKTYVQPNFMFTVLENNYASFYDNARQNWSILFQSSPDVQQFAKQVAIARYNSQNKEEKIIMQDLIPLSATKANKNDIVNLEYSCSLLNNDNAVPFKERSIWPVAIADTYTFPWEEEGLKDCGYKCKRVVIIPYRLSAPWTDEIHQNSSVLLEFEVESVRSPERSRQNKTTMPVKAKTHDESTTDSSAEEDNCRAKPVSLKDSIFLSRSHKADLISRIAKMGQALPLKVAFACGPSDSLDENQSQLRQANHRPCSPQQTDTHQQYLLPTSSSRRGEADVAWQQQQMVEPNKHYMGGMNFAYQELYPMMSGPPGPSGQNYMRGTESTGTDAELRLTINKVSEKVDYVLNKLQNFDAASWDKAKAHQTATLLDPVSVINSIQDVMAENESLKMEIQQQKSKINEQGCKLHSLMELTQRCVERCALPERQPISTPAAEKTFEDRLNTSDQLMAEANARMNRLTSEIEKYREEISENQQQIRKFNAEIQVLVDKLKEKERTIRNMETELIRTSAENEALMSANDQQKKEIQRIRQQDAGEKSMDLQHDSSEEIKKVMNAVNRKLQSYFDSDQFYSGKDIKATIATTLKDVTMDYLRYRNKLKSSSRMDNSQRDLSGPTEMRKEVSPARLTESSLGAVEADNLTKEKSRTTSDVTRATSQRLAFADEQTLTTPLPSSRPSSDMSATAHNLKTEESLIPATARASSLHQGVRSADATSSRPSSDMSATAHNLKTEESLIPATAQASSLHRGVRSADATSSLHVTTPNVSALTHDMKSTETFRGESQRDVEQYPETEEYSGLNNRESAASSTRTPPIDSKFSIMQYSHKSTLTASRPPSGEEESIRRDMSTAAGDLESLVEDEKVEIEKSTVNLSSTLSDITRGPTAPPPSHASSITRRAETSSSLGKGLPNIAEDFVTPSGRSTFSAAGQSSRTEEDASKKTSIKSNTVTVSREESVVPADGRRSSERHVESFSVNRESEIPTTSGRSTITARATSSEMDESMRRPDGSTLSKAVAGAESSVTVVQENISIESGMGREKSGSQQSSSGRSAVTTKALPSQMDVNFTNDTIYSRSGIVSVDQEQRKSSVKGDKLGDASGSTTGSSPHSDTSSVTTDGEGRDVRKSISETDLSKFKESGTQIEDESTANAETEKSRVTLNKTPSNVTKDRQSIQAPSETSCGRISDCVPVETKIELQDEGKSSLTTGVNSREEMDASNERDEIDEIEKSSVDEKVSPSASDENVKTSGSNALHDSPLYSDYYQGWESSKPPPLPLEDDEESTESDEEWL